MLDIKTVPLGTIARGEEIGKANRAAKYEAKACEGCGERRWVQYVKPGGVSAPYHTRKQCRKCWTANRRHHTSWGGKFLP